MSLSWWQLILMAWAVCFALGILIVLYWDGKIRAIQARQEREADIHTLQQRNERHTDGA